MSGPEEYVTELGSPFNSVYEMSPGTLLMKGDANPSLISEPSFRLWAPVTYATDSRTFTTLESISISEAASPYRIPAYCPALSMTDRPLPCATRWYGSM